MLLHVDHTTEDLRLMETDLTKGQPRFARFLKEETPNLKITAQTLLIHILKKKPTQVIFDKTGVGMGLYDSFVELLKDIDCIKMEQNGELIYKDQEDEVDEFIESVYKGVQAAEKVEILEKEIEEIKNEKYKIQDGIDIMKAAGYEVIGKDALGRPVFKLNK